MIKRNLIANYLGQAWVGLMSLAFIPLYIRFLGIEAYGVIGLFALLQAWLVMLDMGMTTTLSREMARLSGPPFVRSGCLVQEATGIRDLLRSIEIVAIGLVLFVTGAIALASDWLAGSWLQADTLPVETIAQAFAVMGLVIGLRYLEGIYVGALIGLQRQVPLNAVTGIMATVRGLGALAILALIEASIQAFFVWQAIASLTTLCILATTTYLSLPAGERAGRFSLAALQRVWRFAGGMVVITVLGLLLTQSDKLLLSNLLTLSEYGHYTLAAALAGGLYMLVNPITQAWFPRLSQLFASHPGNEGDRHPDLDRTYHLGAQLISVTVGSAAIILIVFSETVLRLWTQNPVLAHRTAPLVSLLALGNLLHALMWIPYQTQLAHGWTSLTARMNGLALLLVVPALLWVTPRHGAEGAAWVWISLNAGFVLIGAHFMFRRILREEKWQWYWWDNFSPLMVGAAVALTVNFVMPVTADAILQFTELIVASALTLAAASIAAPEIRKKVVLSFPYILGKFKWF